MLRDSVCRFHYFQCNVLCVQFAHHTDHFSVWDRSMIWVITVENNQSKTFMDWKWNGRHSAFPLIKAMEWCDTEHWTKIGKMTQNVTIFNWTDLKALTRWSYCLDSKSKSWKPQWRGSGLERITQFACCAWVVLIYNCEKPLTDQAHIFIVFRSIQYRSISWNGQSVSFEIALTTLTLKVIVCVFVYGS